MTPSQQAYAYYEKPEGNVFHEVLDAHLLNHYVFSTPEFFLIGKPVNRRAPLEHILDIHFIFPNSEWDAWFVYFYAGQIKNVFTLMPFPLPYCSFEHRNKIRFYSLAKYKSKIRN